MHLLSWFYLPSSTAAAPENCEIHDLSIGSRLASSVPWRTAPETLRPARKVMLIATRPGANPVAGLPARAAGAASATKAKASDSRHITAVESTGRIIFGGAALKAARAAGKVVCATVAHTTVPVAWPHVGPGTEPERRDHPATAETAVIPSVVTARSRLAAPLARVPSLKVHVLA